MTTEASLYMALNKYLKWSLLFIPALLVEAVCYFTNWIACIFIVIRERDDRVKRLGNAQFNMLREYPIGIFMLWNTHDNALDEYWWGLFNEDSWFKSVREATQEDYDNNWWLRYFCRVAWLMRNNGYGWLYKFFSVPVEPIVKSYTRGIEKQGFWYLLQIYKNSFKLEMQIPLGKRYFSMNIGWKEHKGFPNKLYANRIISFRKYK